MGTRRFFLCLLALLQWSGTWHWTENQLVGVVMASVCDFHKVNYIHIICHGIEGIGPLVDNLVQVNHFSNKPKNKAF